MTSATSISPTNTASAIIPVVCPPDADPATFVITDTAYDGDGRMINSRFLDGMTIADAKEEVARRLEDREPRQPAGGRAQGEFPPARLGHLAPALLGLPDPDHPLRGLRRRAGAEGRPAGDAAGRRHLRRAGQSARPPSDLEACRLPAMRQAGPPRDRHHGHLRRFVLVFRPLHRPDAGPTRPTDRAAVDRWLPVDQYIGGIEHAILHLLYSPLLHARHAEDRPCRPRRAVRRPVHAGHGGARDLQGRRTAAGCCRARCASRQDGAAPQGLPCGDRRADRDRLDREDVEVEEEHRRPRRHHRVLRRRYRALVHAVRFAARARRDLDRGGRAGRRPLRAARLAPGRRTRRSHAPAARTPRPTVRCGARRPQGRPPGARRGRGRYRAPALQPLRRACSTSSPTPARFARTVDSAAPRLASRRLPRGRPDPGAAHRADDAASGRGMLGSARPAGPRRRHALAGRRSGPAGRGRRSPCRSRSTARSART